MFTSLDPKLEQTWLEHFQKGDVSTKDEIFQNIFQNFQTQVISICLHITGTPEEAEDASQETFLAVFQNLSKFRGESSLSTWIYRIAIRASYRVRSKRQKRIEPLEKEYSEGSSEEKILDREKGVLFRKALEILSASHRMVISLFMVKGLSQKEISEVLNIPEGTVWSRMYQAKKQLAQEIARLKK